MGTTHRGGPVSRHAIEVRLFNVFALQIHLSLAPEGVISSLWIYTGVHFMVRSGFREYDVKKLRSPACSRQENATFPTHIHRTWSAP